MSVKIPSVKKVPSAKRLATRGGALELVGYLNGQLSVFGKIRGAFGKESYSFDKVVGTAKDMIKNLEKEDSHYFSEENLNSPIELDFMKILFEMIGNYTVKGTNEKRKETLREVLCKNCEVMDILRKDEFHNKVEGVDKRINQLQKIRGKVGFDQEAQEVSAAIEELLQYGKTIRPDVKDVKKLSKLKDTLSQINDIENIVKQVEQMLKDVKVGTDECRQVIEQASKLLVEAENKTKKFGITLPNSFANANSRLEDIKKEHEEIMKDLNNNNEIKSNEKKPTAKDINGQVNNIEKEVNELLDNIKDNLGTSVGEDMLKDAKDKLEQTKKILRDNKLPPRSTQVSISKRLEEVEKNHLQAANTLKEIDVIVEQVEQMLKDVKVGTDKCRQIIEQANKFLIEAREKVKVVKIKIPKNWTEAQNKLENVRKEQMQIERGGFIEKYGQNPIVEHQGGISNIFSSANKTTVEKIWNYCDEEKELKGKMNVLKKSNLLGGPGNKGNYQVFDSRGKELCKEWEDIAPKVKTGLKRIIPAMKRDEIFECIIKSCKAQKFVKN